MASLGSLTEAWLAIDKDPETRHEIEQLVAEDNTAELAKRLRGRMTFGTAGLRARNEAGTTRMNCVTVIQASQGLAAYVLKKFPDASSRGVVIGHDARHNGNKFARLAAAAFVQKGIKVYWFGRFVHTPLIPFTINEVHAVAGIMITASHNPAADQGYKCYGDNGCQIIPPADKEIALAIDQNLEPLSWEATVVDGHHQLVEEVSENMITAYTQRVAQYVAPDGPVGFPAFVYTPMHGVGLPYLEEVVRRVSTSTKFTVVAEQSQPDPTFPTIRFPNPEEKGALDLAKKTADEADIQLIIATDPDADRLAVAEKVDGTWYQFTGNEVGVLLASYVLSEHQGSQHTAMLNSTVSSAMLRNMCEAHNIHFVATLTGFKWLGNTALRLSNPAITTPPATAIFAYEEALGYMFPSILTDKDGISGACVFLKAASTWQAEGLTPYAKLQQLYEQYGFFGEANTYLVSPSPQTTVDIFKNIRMFANLTSIGGKKINRFCDLTIGFDSATPNNVPDLPVDGNSQMITCEAEGGIRFTARGSGTEPKIKLYIEAVATESDGGMAVAKATAMQVQRALIEEWFEPKRWGLQSPA
jgi:phosphoglucomutase